MLSNQQERMEISQYSLLTGAAALRRRNVELGNRENLCIKVST
jgi:hypothetical protein